MSKESEQKVVDMIWNIAKISPEYGKALMDILGYELYKNISIRATKVPSNEEILISKLEEKFPSLFYTNMSHTPTKEGEEIKQVIKEVMSNAGTK